jgi:PDZ domain/Aspartyl protease
MSMKLLLYTLLYSLLQMQPCIAQVSSVLFPEHETRVEIPFEMQGSFIILPVMFQRIYPLRFIYDTGAETSVLLKKEISDMLGVVYERDITVYGSDMKTPLMAKIARKVHMDLPNIRLVKDILVLNEDYFRFEESAGVEIHGILGSETFKGHVVKINYARQMLTVYAKEAFKPAREKDYQSIPIKMIRNKPYLQVHLTLQNDTIVPVKLLLDTGASLSMILYSGSTPGLTIPQTALKGSIGRGLGGILEGYIGRVKKMDIGNFPLTHVVSRFQVLPTDMDTTQTTGRNGVIGGEILSRFNIIFDYPNQTMYLQPNDNYKTEFIYDRSGLTMLAGGRYLTDFTVQEVLPNTPAALADIRAGDQIVKIGIWSTNFYRLSQVVRKFQGRIGKEIRLTVLRDGKKLQKKITLKELI